MNDILLSLGVSPLILEIMNQVMHSGNWAVRLLVFYLGACVGSFVFACAYRIPIGKSIVFPTSSCPHCGKKLGNIENFPIFGYLFLRGKCMACRATIPVGYVIAEIAAGLCILAIFITHGEPQLTWAPCLWTVFVFSWLLCLSVIDMQKRLLPDAVVLTAAMLLLIFSPSAHAIDPPSWLAINLQILCFAYLFWPFAIRTLDLLAGGSVAEWLRPRAENFFLYRGYYADPQWLGFSLACAFGAMLIHWKWIVVMDFDRILAGLTPAFFAWLVGLGVSRWQAKEALGMGDVKLMVVMGWMLGWPGILMALCIACISALIVGLSMRIFKEQDAQPFGPFLCLGLFSVWAYPEILYAWFPHLSSF